jgi:hypothetical protein
MMTVLTKQFVLSPQQQAGDPTTVVVICPRLIDEVPGTNEIPPRNLDFTIKQALERSYINYGTTMDTISLTVISPSMFHEMMHVTVLR